MSSKQNYIEQRVLVTAIIIKDHKLLMQKRIEKDYSRYHDKWTTPSGVLKINEHPEDCIVREVKEELNLDVKIIAMLPLVESFPNHKDKYHFVYIGFLCEVIGGKLANTDPDHDISEVGWFDIRKLDQIVIRRGTRPTVLSGYKLWKILKKKNLKHDSKEFILKSSSKIRYKH